MKLCKNILVYSSFFLLFLLVSFIIAPLCGDEIWNFGFSYNMYSGLVPYRDFNVIVTPLYFMINALAFKIFSPNAFIMHVISAIFATISLIFIRKINQKSFYFIYIFIVLIGIGIGATLFPGYNLFSLYLFIIIFTLDYENKSPFLIGIFTGLLFTVKQSIGIFVFVPLLINVFKDFKIFLKNLLGFIIPIILLLIYLIFNNALFKFVNYCFLGLFDFSKKNGIFGIIFIVELIVIFILIKNLIKDKENSRSYLYLLCFQIVTYPIFDFPHFIISFIPSFIFLTKDINLNKLFKYIATFTLVFIVVRIFIAQNSNGSKFFEYRYIVDGTAISRVYEIGEYIKDNSGKYDIHFISGMSYFVKLENDLPIDEFDLLNYGNLGYNSYNKYVSKISNSDKDSLFILYYDEDLVTQLHKEIINYIIDNSILIDNICGYNVYKFEVS